MINRIMELVEQAVDKADSAYDISQQIGAQLGGLMVLFDTWDMNLAIKATQEVLNDIKNHTKPVVKDIGLTDFIPQLQKAVDDFAAQPLPPHASATRAAGLHSPGIPINPFNR